MDLFTYLGAKNGKFTLPHKSDLFAYLLGKNSKLPIQTASGTTLEITAKKTNVLELTLDKMCSQDGTPTPDNPIPVIVAEGYRNLFSGDFSQFDNTGGTGTTYAYFKLPEDNETYTLTLIAKNDYSVPNQVGIGFTGNGGNAASGFRWVVYQNKNITAGQVFTYSTNELRFISLYPPNTKTLKALTDNFYIQLEKGETIRPYVPYGTNYINLNITDGVNSINKQIPLNDNFIGGIGDYKDVLTIDETGSISLVKNIGKVVLNGIENYSVSNGMFYTSNPLTKNTTGITHVSNYFVGGTNRNTTGSMFNNNPDNSICTAESGTLKNLFIKATDFEDATAFKTWLTTHNTDVYYVLTETTTVDLGNIDISLFKGTNIITNSDNCNMTIKYY